MKWDRVKRSVLGVLAVVLLLLGALPATTQAQYRRHTRVVIVPRPFFHSGFYGPRWYGPSYVRVYDPIAYQRETGYSDGLSRGKDDAKHGKPNDPSSHKHYRDS